jgi:hypothetical protein
MSMFDSGLSRKLNDFPYDGNMNVNAFYQYANIAATDDDNFVSMVIRFNGRNNEFLRMTRVDYENAIRLPVQCTRQGNNVAQKFFMWHWLEEQNKLNLFFNKLKELQNA